MKNLDYFEEIFFKIIFLCNVLITNIKVMVN